MKRARVFVNKVEAGFLEEIEKGKHYCFRYLDDYKGPSVSLLMPLTQSVYLYDLFPPFFEGLLPEGLMLEGLIKYGKIDRYDFLSQIIAVGGDLVGNITVEAA